jgi:hypothetical protein
MSVGKSRRAWWLGGLAAFAIAVLVEHLTNRPVPKPDVDPWPCGLWAEKSSDGSCVPRRVASATAASAAPSTGGSSSISSAAHHFGGGLGWVVGLIVLLALVWLALSMIGGTPSASTELAATTPDMACLYEILVGKNTAHDAILCTAGVFGRSDGGAVVRPTGVRADLHPYTAEVSFKPVPGTGSSWRGFCEGGELLYLIGGSSGDPLLVRADAGRVVISRQHTEIPEPAPPVDHTKRDFSVGEVPRWYEEDE